MQALHACDATLQRFTLHLLFLSSCLVLGGCASTLSPADRQDVAGKTYVITGASSGFGRGVALKLAALKANVVLAARRTEVLEQVAGQARAAGGTALVVTTDVANPQDVQRLADAALQRFNVKGVIYGSHIALQQFRKQRAGVLVNVGSVESEIPLAYHTSYSATKAAVLALGRALNEFA